MTTFIADRQARRLADIEARERAAWEGYRDDLRDLEQGEYEAAEQRSWESLQKALDRLRDERQVVEHG